MAEKSVFEQIKKQNGERFAKAIRGYDNGIFDIPGIVDIVKYAGHEAEPIMDYLESLKQVHIEETGAYQDPLTLLDVAGYNAYYVTNLEEQNAIQDYYADGEKLCTFRDPTRFERYHIINAVRKDVDQIRREDFRGREQREDEYGTSVLSIQILKTGGFISIKNRYNHTVDNPDNTLSSNPDNIIMGLSNSLRHHFQTDFSTHEVHLPNGYTLVDKKIIRYNHELDNIYFGSNFYVRDGMVHPLKPHEMMLDTYIFNMRNKSLFHPYDTDTSEEDLEFKKAFLKEIEGHKVIFKKDKDGQHLFIRHEGEKDPAKDVEILTVKDGVITALNLPTTTELGDFFLLSSTGLKSLSAPNLKSVGTHFLGRNLLLDTLNVPLLETAGDDFLHHNENLCALNLPNIKTIKDGFLSYNRVLCEFNAPKLTCVGNAFLELDTALKTLSLPELIKAGGNFLGSNVSLEHLSAPKLKSVESNFLRENQGLQSLDLPVIESIGYGALGDNVCLHTLNVPNLKHLGAWSFRSNLALTSVEFPLLEGIEEDTLSCNQKMESFSAPKAKFIAKDFLKRCESLRQLNLPMVEHIGENCFTGVLGFPELNLPMVKTISDNFMQRALFLESFSAPHLESLGRGAFFINERLKTFYAPLLLKRPQNLLSKHPDKETLWNNRDKLPLPKPAEVEIFPSERSGISDTLRVAEAEKQKLLLTATPDTQAPKNNIPGISARLKPSADMGQGPIEKTAENTSFFKRLRNWLLPQK